MRHLYQDGVPNHVEPDYIVENRKISVRNHQKETLNELIKIELAFANQQFPAFTSSMEGLGVIQEEYDEAKDDINQIKKWFKLFKQELRTETPNVQYHSQQMKLHIQNAILELIQVSAMLDKFQNVKGEIK